MWQQRQLSGHVCYHGYVSFSSYNRRIQQGNCSGVYVEGLGEEGLTVNSLSVSHTSLPFFASGGLDFWHQNYFRFVARCVAHICAFAQLTQYSQNRSEELLTFELLILVLRQHVRDGVGLTMFGLCGESFMGRIVKNILCL